ncbi:endolytic transglycosylase MltG [Methylobacillus arboreus]|uniref:endolytic transglycosylase MltG n=1 Tax=Methylobacillus arboreus TaxID=755170 RepID=UPI001E3197A9|nr:endolytic transglycosylase MltG [Methylobacillus arboreus]MCB5189863.1 endolytic transglycosylase MltG [Methylobacillus arboreus]
MRILKALFLLLVLLVASFCAWMAYFVTTPLHFPTQTVEFELRAGSSLRTVSQQLVDQNILKEPWSFILLVRAMHMAGGIKAGNYLLESGQTPYELFITLSNGNVTQDSITFIEGWTFAQMRQALNQHESVRHLTMAYTDEEIMRNIGATDALPEGLFFPDTYYFSRGMSDQDILKRAYVAMQNRLQAAWVQRAPGLPYASPYEALIMASIVEKETGKASERPIIAGVFLNRLRIGMRLQTDPTVIYGMGETFDGNLRKRDLLRDTPFNTYTRAGLPPTPIAMPGMAAITAALHPAKTDAIYFVGKGDGSHQFSRTLSEHNRAVVRYQLKGGNAR